MSEQGSAVSFSTFALSLGTNAMVALGEVPNPETGALQAPDLRTARQFTDLLSMLQEKTKGNLTAEEQDLLNRLVGDLRMMVVTRQQDS